MGPHTPIVIANFVLGPERRAADQRLGAHLRAAVGDRLHEALVGRLRHRRRLSRAARRSKLLSEYEGFSSHANAVSEMRDKLLAG